MLEQFNITNPTTGMPVLQNNMDTSLAVMLYPAWKYDVAFYFILALLIFLDKGDWFVFGEFCIWCLMLVNIKIIIFNAFFPLSIH